MLAGLVDSRRSRGGRHTLLTIMPAAVIAVLAGRLRGCQLLRCEGAVVAETVSGSRLVAGGYGVGSVDEQCCGYRVDVVQDPIDGYGCVSPSGLGLGFGQQLQPVNTQFLAPVDGSRLSGPTG